MENLMWPIIGLTIFSVSTMLGIFLTKAPGFGKYSVSVIILLVITFIAAYFLLFGLITSSIFANVIFAVAGYAGGLINANRES